MPGRQDPELISSLKTVLTFSFPIAPLKAIVASQGAKVSWLSITVLVIQTQEQVLKT